MKVLAVHPGVLMYSKVFLRLEPLGLELVAEAARQAGHEVQLIDLQVDTHRTYFRMLKQWQPRVVCFSCNYLANVPEIIDLAAVTKQTLPNSFIVVGGHSASFIAEDLLAHAGGAIDCVLKGEGEASIGCLLEAVEHHAGDCTSVPGVVTLNGPGPPPVLAPNLDDVLPARHLLHHRRKYFLGMFDPCASIEFSRGCPWDCTFCSAWTFYGRSYRIKTPETIVAELEQIREPGIFVVDDVAFIQADHGFEIGEAIARKGIRKRYYLETRGDVLLRHPEVFKFWRTLGLEYIFLGLEAMDEAGLKTYRKRVTVSENVEALAYARSLGIQVAVNIIADPDWDRDRFAALRQFCLDIPEIVNISVNTPYPGTETWRTESRKLTTRDYRLFDIQHAVLPTKLSLPEFYHELVKTQQILNQKHMSWKAARATVKLAAGYLLRGQTNFVKMLWKFNSVYDPNLFLADHRQPVKHEITLPPEPGEQVDPRTLYIYTPGGRRGRALDGATEAFVDKTRMGTGR